MMPVRSGEGSSGGREEEEERGRGGASGRKKVDRGEAPVNCEEPRGEVSLGGRKEKGWGASFLSPSF